MRRAALVAPLPQVRDPLRSAGAVSGRPLVTLALAVAGTLALAGPPACSHSEQPALVRPARDGRWTLLDTAFELDEDWAPADLTSLRQAGFGDDRLIRTVVVPDLRALREAAAGDGIELEIQSAYRSFAYQEATFAAWVEQDGYQAALASSARAGHSEHQLGTTLDFRSLGGPAPWDLPDWASTPEGAWMVANAWRFGFVMSYPRGARERSCYAYEPWHWRWVGPSLAADLRVGDRTLRELLWEENHD